MTQVKGEGFGAETQMCTKGEAVKLAYQGLPGLANGEL